MAFFGNTNYLNQWGSNWKSNRVAKRDFPPSKLPSSYNKGQIRSPYTLREDVGQSGIILPRRPGGNKTDLMEAHAYFPPAIPPSDYNKVVVPSDYKLTEPRQLASTTAWRHSLFDTETIADLERPETTAQKQVDPITLILHMRKATKGTPNNQFWVKASQFLSKLDIITLSRPLTNDELAKKANLMQEVYARARNLTPDIAIPRPPIAPGGGPPGGGPPGGGPPGPPGGPPGGGPPIIATQSIAKNIADIKKAKKDQKAKDAADAQFIADAKTAAKLAFDKTQAKAKKTTDAVAAKAIADKAIDDAQQAKTDKDAKAVAKAAIKAKDAAKSQSIIDKATAKAIEARDKAKREAAIKLTEADAKLKAHKLAAAKAKTADALAKAEDKKRNEELEQKQREAKTAKAEAAAAKTLQKFAKHIKKRDERIKTRKTNEAADKEAHHSTRRNRKPR